MGLGARGVSVPLGPGFGLGAWDIRFRSDPEHYSPELYTRSPRQAPRLRSLVSVSPVWVCEHTKKGPMRVRHDVMMSIGVRAGFYNGYYEGTAVCEYRSLKN